MSSRRVNIVLLCEDSQHEAFVKRFLSDLGWDKRQIFVTKSPLASGSAEQWVKQRFPIELNIYRQRRQRAASAMITMIDADTKSIQERIKELEDECTKKQISFRTSGESVGIAVPKRNIETWIHFLNGSIVNEEEVYQKLNRERDCSPAVKNLVQLCRTTGLSKDSPSSLLEACIEYNERIKPLQ